MRAFNSKRAKQAGRVLEQLEGGHRNSLGQANSVAISVGGNPRRFRELIAGMWSEDPVVRMRAADAAEKACRSKPALLAPLKAPLLGLLREECQQEVRWHLAAMIPRLPLSAIETLEAAARFREYLNDRSSIVRTFALQALFDLAQQEPALRDETLELLHAAVQSGTAAMKARARKLLKQMEAGT